MQSTTSTDRPDPIHHTRKPRRRRSSVASGDRGSSNRAAPQLLGTGGGIDHEPLARYTDAEGRSREIVCRPGNASSLLVLDRDPCDAGETRLIAHLGADEPPENAELVCSQYLGTTDDESRRCRRVTDADLRLDPRLDEAPVPAPVDAGLDQALILAGGAGYGLALIPARTALVQLRWCHLQVDARMPRPHSVSLREVVAAAESYEPAVAATVRALGRHRDDSTVSTTTLQAELARVRESPIVLNRGLREAVQIAVERGQLSLSEIAMRCGRIKRDRNGNESGETSWLARRVGLLPEGGQSEPTPWIHSDVLGLVSRSGLGVSPREVELT